MYQIYVKSDEREALVCFEPKHSHQIHLFYDLLASKLISIHDLIEHKVIGGPTPADAWSRYFFKKEQENIWPLLEQTPPNFFQQIFKTSKWEIYLRNQSAIAQQVVLEIETSHDHPCIELHDRLHPESEIASFIESTALELNISVSRNSDLPSIRAIIMSNHKF
jgi:hypothetical protein